MASQPRLVYFDFPGRAFPARVCLRAAGKAFVDERIKFEDWPALKPALPLGQVPVLEVDGKCYCQSIPISCYAAKLAGLYPEKPLEQLHADEFVAIVDEAWSKASALISGNDEEKRAAYVNDVAPKYLRAIEARLGNDTFLGGSPTPRWADLWLYVFVSSMSSGNYAFIPKDLISKNAPKAAAHLSAVRESELYKKFCTPE